MPVNNDTLVTFTDNANTASLKVCKFLTANSGALAGQTFWFSVSDPGIPTGTAGSAANPVLVPVIATASSTGACSIVGGSANPLAVPGRQHRDRDREPGGASAATSRATSPVTVPRPRS